MDLSPPDDVTPVAQVIGYDWEPVPMFRQGKVWWESVRMGKVWCDCVRMGEGVVGECEDGGRGEGVVGECEGSGRSDGRV